MIIKTITPLFVFLAYTLASQETVLPIPLNEVQHHLGKNVKVCDSIVDTYITKGDKKTTYLHIGAAFPNAKLTVVIFEDDVVKFDSHPAIFLKDKRVCITGILKDYKGKMEIIVNKPTQIELE